MAAHRKRQQLRCYHGRTISRRFSSVTPQNAAAPAVAFRNDSVKMSAPPTEWKRMPAAGTLMIPPVKMGTDARQGATLPATISRAASHPLWNAGYSAECSLRRAATGDHARAERAAPMARPECRKRVTVTPHVAREFHESDEKRTPRRRAERNHHGIWIRSRALPAQIVPAATRQHQRQPVTLPAQHKHTTTASAARRIAPILRGQHGDTGNQEDDCASQSTGQVLSLVMLARSGNLSI